MNVSTDVDVDGHVAQRLLALYGGPVAAAILALTDDPSLVDPGVYRTIVTLQRGPDVDTMDDATVYALARRVGGDLADRDRADSHEAVGNETIGNEAIGNEAVGNEVEGNRDETIDLTYAGGPDRVWEIWEVRRALDRLSPEESGVVRLEHLGKLTHPDIAARLGTTVGTVKSRSYGAHRRLILLLEPFISGRMTEPSGKPGSDPHLSVSTEQWLASVGGGAAEERTSALSWYLAGHADGASIQPAERDVARRIREHLADPAVWAAPGRRVADRLGVVAEPSDPSGEPGGVGLRPAADGGSGVPTPLFGRAPILADSSEVDDRSRPRVVHPLTDSGPLPAIADTGAGAAVEEPAPPGPAAEHAAGTGGSIVDLGADESSPNWLAAAGVALVAIAGLLVYVVVSGDEDPVTAGPVDGWAVDLEPVASLSANGAIDGIQVLVADSESGADLTVNPGDLPPIPPDAHYAIWLRDGELTVPAGSFRWAQTDAPVRLHGGVDIDDFDQLLITAQMSPDEIGGLDTADEVIYSGALSRPSDPDGVDTPADIGDSVGSN